MKHFLNEAERLDLERLVKESEPRAGAQIVLAVIGKSDNYTEIPWKAFAAGAVLSGLVVLAVSLIYPVWISGSVILISLATVSGTGIILALATSGHGVHGCSSPLTARRPKPCNMLNPCFLIMSTLQHLNVMEYS